MGTLTNNMMTNNGSQFDEITISRMIGALDGTNQACRNLSKKLTFPDGDSLLMIEHDISQFDKHSFPEGWGDGEPFECYWQDYCVESDHSGGSNGDYHDDLIDPYGIWDHSMY